MNSKNHTGKITDCLFLSPSWDTEKITRYIATYRPDRISLGCEFCEKLFDPLQLEQKLKQIQKKSIPVTLVLPWLGPTLFSEHIRTIKNITQHHALDEVVVNDWGVMEELSTCNSRLIIGRLLNTQKKDTRITHEKTVHPPYLPASLHGRWQMYSIIAYETDCLQDFTEAPLEGHLHYPYSYLTAARKCLPANTNSLRQKVAVNQICDRSCLSETFRLEHSAFPDGLLLKGAAIFHKSKSRPSGNLLQKHGITRLINHPEMTL